MDAPEGRICTQCKEFKIFTEFNRLKANKWGYESQCRACARNRQMRDYNNLSSEARKKRYPYNKARVLKYKYGIEWADYLTLKELQENLCAICGSPESERALDVDHNHLTNTVRGLLCHKCNKALGMFDDNPSLLEAAAQYLVQAQP